MLVTTADASPELVEFCEQQDIVLITGVELVKWIYEHIDRVALEWRASLGISRTGEILFDS